MCKTKRLLGDFAAVVLVSLATFVPVAIGGIPEPGIIYYGKVCGDSGTLIAEGELTWTLTPTGGGNPVTVTTQLSEIQGPLGFFSYTVLIPCETEVPGDPVSDNTISLTSTPVEYARAASVAGTTISMSDTVSISTADRGSAKHVAVCATVPDDTDGDGLPDEWEQQIVDADPNDDITSVANVLPGDDFDGDGVSNWTEYVNATDPTDANNYPGLAGAAVDMDISTRDYDDMVSSTDIESTAWAPENGDVWIAVVAQGVTNLDTYQLEVDFDPNRVEFIEGIEDNPIEGIHNLLKKDGSITAGFQADEIVNGTVYVANALIDGDCDEAPEGSGIIALLHFRVLDSGPDNELTLGNVSFVNCAGYQEEISNLTDGSFTGCAQWDFNSDGICNYLDLGLFADHWLYVEDDAGWDSKYNLSPVADSSSGKQIINYLDLGIFADHWLEERASP